MKRKERKKKSRLKLIITTDIILLAILCGVLLMREFQKDTQEVQSNAKIEAADNEEKKTEEEQEIEEVQEKMCIRDSCFRCVTGMRTGNNNRVFI